MINNENNSFDDAADNAGADEKLTSSPADETVAAPTFIDEELTESPSRPRWFRPAIVAAVVVPLLGLGGGVAAAAHKTIEFEYDGDVTEVTTWSGSVEGFLENEGVELAEHDEVIPALDATLEEGSTVVVRVAQQVSLDIDGENATIWTTADSTHELMTFLSASGRDGSIQASSRSIADGRDPLDLPLVDDGDVMLKVDGVQGTLYFADPTTLQDALDEFGIELGETDEFAIEAGPTGEVLVTITRIEFSERTETEEIDFETETRNNGDMYKDESKVIQAGEAGERTFVYEVKTVDGDEAEAIELSNEVTKDPVTRIVEQGTKARPAPAASSGGGGGGGTVSGDVWSRLAQCESGGNPSAVSPSGTYHGLYQFSVATWQSVGGSGLPSQASPAEQTQRAQALQARSGWGQWPHCSSVLGLR